MLPTAPAAAAPPPTEPLQLTGRALLAPNAARALRCRVSFAHGLSDVQWPLDGDVRLDITADRSALTGKPAGSGLLDRPGLVLAAVFFGVAWHRLDLSNLSSLTRYSDGAQLEGVLRWLCSVIRSAQGRNCEPWLDPATGSSGFIVVPLEGGPSAARAGGTARRGLLHDLTR